MDEQASARRRAIAEAWGLVHIAEDFERVIAQWDDVNRRGIAACRAALTTDRQETAS